jgi:hypothetical protein
MGKPELLITPVPSGNALLRGSCSVCRNVTFGFVGDTPETRRLMQLAFERHVRDVHMRDDASSSSGSAVKTTLEPFE